MDNLIVVFTMEGCPFCEMMKNQLNENKIEYVIRDIHEHKEEYDLFVKTTGSEFVPAFMVIKDPHGNPESSAYVPDKDYNTIEEGINIIKKLIN